MRGRKPTSDHLKLVKGTLRKDRVNADAPVADVDSPRPPGWLSRRAVEHFGVLRERIEGLSIASKTDTEMLALAAERLAEIEECDELITEHGRLIEAVVNKNGDTSLRSNPAVAQKNEAMRHLQSLLSEFGLTPATRSKITAPKKKENVNPFAAVNGKN